MVFHLSHLLQFSDAGRCCLKYNQMQKKIENRIVISVHDSAGHALLQAKTDTHTSSDISSRL